MDIVDHIVAWMEEYLWGAGADGFVIGLSGGVDSATAAALFEGVALEVVEQSPLLTLVVDT